MTRRPVTVDGKPVLYFNPNDYCGDLDCETCGGRPWVAAEGHELHVGQEVGLYWFHLKEENPDPEKILWTTIAGHEDEYGDGGWYVDL